MGRALVLALVADVACLLVGTFLIAADRCENVAGCHNSHGATVHVGQILLGAFVVLTIALVAVFAVAALVAAGRGKR